MSAQVPSPTASPPTAGTALTLAECRHLAVSNNLVLRAQREALLAAGYLRRAETGIFEPEAVASVERVANHRQNTTEQFLSQQSVSEFREDNEIYGAGLEGLAPTGARFRIGYTVRDLENNLHRVYTTPADRMQNEWQSFIGITLTQPLLKDFGFPATMARIRLARGEEALALQEYRRQSMLVIGAVEAAYWDLYVAQIRDGFRRESVTAAQKLLAENRARVGEGKMAEIELVEAESGLAQRRSLGAESAQRLLETATRLKTLIAEPVTGDDWTVQAIDLPPAPGLPGAIEDALRDAFVLHPEYLARRHRTEQEGVRVAYAGNQRWPQVDLKASFGYNGLGPDHDSAWFDIDRRRFESWTVGLEMRVPIGLGVRRGNELKAAQARQREALFNLKAAEIEILNNLQGAWQRVENLLVVASNYADVASASRRLLDNELSRLTEGKSESRRVLEVESMLADARIAELESRGEYEKARIELELACGRLLQARGLEPAVADLAPEAQIQLDREARAARQAAPMPPGLDRHGHP